MKGFKQALRRAPVHSRRSRLFHEQHSLSLGRLWAADAVEIYAAGYSLIIHVSAIPECTLPPVSHFSTDQAPDQLSLDIVCSLGKLDVS